MPKLLTPIAVASLLLLSLIAVPFAQAQGKPNVELLALAKLEKQRDAAKVVFLKHPSKASKQRFIQLNDKLANDTMMAQSLTPHEKYTKALRLYRYSMKVDPQDSEASKWVHEIESIYKSMGKPIPK